MSVQYSSEKTGTFLKLGDLNFPTMTEQYRDVFVRNNTYHHHRLNHQCLPEDGEHFSKFLPNPRRHLLLGHFLLNRLLVNRKLFFCSVSVSSVVAPLLYPSNLGPRILPPNIRKNLKFVKNVNKQLSIFK